MSMRGRNTGGIAVSRKTFASLKSKQSTKIFMPPPAKHSSVLKLSEVLNIHATSRQTFVSFKSKQGTKISMPPRVKHSAVLKVSKVLNSHATWRQMFGSLKSKQGTKYSCNLAPNVPRSKQLVLEGRWGQQIWQEKTIQYHPVSNFRHSRE